MFVNLNIDDKFTLLYYRDLFDPVVIIQASYVISAYLTLFLKFWTIQ